MWYLFFFFNDTATTEIYTLSLHDALPILQDVRGALVEVGESQQARLVDRLGRAVAGRGERADQRRGNDRGGDDADRKSTRLNSSHANISYAVFCLKKKTEKAQHEHENTEA